MANPVPTKEGQRPTRIDGTITFAIAGPNSFIPAMETEIGYARCSTHSQDFKGQQRALLDLGVRTDHGLTGANRERPCLDQALAPCARTLRWLP